jgi:hypothetical protein
LDERDVFLGIEVADALSRLYPRVRQSEKEDRRESTTRRPEVGGLSLV